MPTRRQCANAIRVLAMDAIQQANSGHPGAPLGMADMAEALWRHVLKHNPCNPHWPNRDRFVLSNGHASMLLYAVLHLTGYPLSMDELRRFRQWGSPTPGHPERDVDRGVEMTTGPLGQGIASAVGMAMAERLLAARYNTPEHTIVDHRTWVFLGDGCLMEGVSHEACSLAGTWGLGKLNALYDANGISIDGQVDAWFTENVPDRFRAYGWQVIGPVDGHDFAALDAALAEAMADTRRPGLIICRTHIGYASPKADSASSHGAPLGEAAVAATRDALDWHEPPFTVPSDILNAWDARSQGKAAEAAWQQTFDAWAALHPQLAAEYARRLRGDLPEGWEDMARAMVAQAARAQTDEPTRVSSRKVLEYLVPRMPELVGGSADLTSSVGTLTPDSVAFDAATPAANYLYYGVREFAMGAIMNGLALHGGCIPYAGTFLSFADQAKNALRLAAIMRLRVIWVFTHDSIGVGEDGSTHQPIEQLGMLRLTPGLHVWRPCDDVETAVAWRCALECQDAPTVLSLSRQKVRACARTEQQVSDIAKGGYVLRPCEGTPDAILIATGSEVCLALDAAAELTRRGRKIQVVSLPCTSVFESQDAAWKEHVLPAAVRARLAIEASAADWWRMYVGLDGMVLGMEGYGVSAPGTVLFEKFGFTVPHVVELVERMCHTLSR